MSAMAMGMAGVTGAVFMLMAVPVVLVVPMIVAIAMHAGRPVHMDMNGVACVVMSVVGISHCNRSRSPVARVQALPAKHCLQAPRARTISSVKPSAGRPYAPPRLPCLQVSPCCV